MSPVYYSSDLEIVGEDEARLTADIVEGLVAGSSAASERVGHGLRAAHAKSLAILKGELIVADDLPAELAQGVFVPGRRYQAIARLSSSPGEIQTDKVPEPRGFALKLIGVEGPRISPEIPGANQDFLMVNFPALPFGTIERYKSALGVLMANEHSPEALQRLIAGFASGAKHVLAAFDIAPSVMLDALARDNSHPLGETYSTQAALRFGDHVAKLGIRPKSENLRALTGVAPDDVEFSTLSEAISQVFATQTAEFELTAQLCVDLEAMPVEDASVVWDEALSPHRPVATLRFGPQASYSGARRSYGDDALTFTPWNGVEAHRPLGGIMRVRRAAYAASAKQRFERNGRVRIEPARAQDMPD